MSAESIIRDRMTPQYIDFNDLSDRKIFRSRMTLWRAVRDLGFPPGVLITPSRRVWDEAAVADWLATRPTGPKPGTPNAVAESTTA